MMSASCGLCERVDTTKSAARSASDFAVLVPADVDLAFFASNFKDLRDASNILDKKVTQAISVKAGVAEINQRYGLDLTNVKAVADKGVAVDRGLGVVTIDEQLVFIVPIEGGPGFTRFLTALGKERHGADERGVTVDLVGPNQQKVQMNAVVTKGADAQAAPQLTDDNAVFAWIVRDGTAIVYPGAAASPNTRPAKEILSKFAFVAEADSLGKHKDFDKLKTSLGKEFSIFGVYNASKALNKAVEEMANQPFAKDQMETYKTLAKELGLVGLGVKVEDGSARARLHILTTPETAARIQAAARSKGDLAEFARVIDKNPALTLKLSLDFDKGLKELRTIMQSENRDELDRSMRLVKSVVGVDLKDGVLPALDGNVMVNIYEANPIALAALSQGNYLDFIQGSRATVTFGIQDRAKLLASLDSAQKSFPAMIARSEEGGNIVVYAFHTEAAATPDPVEDNPFKLKLDTFDQKVEDGQTPPTPDGQTPPTPDSQAAPARPAGEPLAHLVVTDKVAMLLTRQMPRKQGVMLASLSGQGPEGPLAHERTTTALAASDTSALVVDIKALLDLLGPQAFAIGGALRSFSVWQLDVRGLPDGAQVQLELVFADQSKTPQDPVGEGQGQTPTPPPGQ